MQKIRKKGIPRKGGCKIFRSMDRGTEKIRSRADLSLWCLPGIMKEKAGSKMWWYQKMYIYFKVESRKQDKAMSISESMSPLFPLFIMISINLSI